MATHLQVVEGEGAPEPLAPAAPVVEEGRLAKMVAKVRALKQSISTSPRFSQVTQLRGLGSASWLVGFVGSILILNRFVSPIITKLAMTTLIAPIAALVLVVIGEFDFTKLTTMVTSNAGIVFATGGIIVSALFVQNVAKMALLTRSFTSQTHKQYRTYSLASMLTPVTTSALWYLATKLGYFFGAKSISLGILAMFASGAVGEALNNIDPFNASTAELASVANAMSNGLRWGLGFLLLVHLFFVFKSYSLVHKTLNALFDYLAKDLTREKIESKMFVQSVDGNNKPRFNDKKEPIMETTGFGCATMVVIIAGVIAGLFWAGSYAFSDTPEERQAKLAAQAVEEKLLLEKRFRVACVGGVTYATENGNAYRLTNADNVTTNVLRGGKVVKTEIPNQIGSSYCVAPVTEKMLRIGGEFSVGSSYRNEVIILDANGYGNNCQKMQNGEVYPDYNSDKENVRDNNYNCRRDRIVGRDVQYWLELPEGLPAGVKMPPLPAPKAPAK